MSVVNYMSVTH